MRPRGTLTDSERQRATSARAKATRFSTETEYGLGRVFLLDDLADVTMLVLERYSGELHLNISPGEEVGIAVPNCTLWGIERAPPPHSGNGFTANEIDAEIRISPLNCLSRLV